MSPYYLILAFLVGGIQSCSAAVGGGPAANLLIADAFTLGFSNNQTAYVLATAEGESGMGQSMTENISEAQANKNYGSILGNSSPGDGYLYRGRGYGQTTGKDNYGTWSNELSVNLVQHPNIAADPDLSAQILTEGLDRGELTGRSLDYYVNSGQTDYQNARKAVGGVDASTYAGYANNFASELAGCN